MHGIVTRVRHQDRINRHLANSDQHQIFSLLTSSLLNDKDEHCLQLWLLTLEKVRMMDEQQLNRLFELMTQNLQVDF